MPSSGMWRRVDVACSQLLTLISRSWIFSTLKIEAIRFSETSNHTRSTRRHIPEDGILHSHRCENLKILHMNKWLFKEAINFVFARNAGKWTRGILKHIKWMPRPTSSSPPPSRQLLHPLVPPTWAQIGAPIHYSSAVSTTRETFVWEDSQTRGSLVAASRSLISESTRLIINQFHVIIVSWKVTPCT
jgi:hypothetical protein